MLIVITGGPSSGKTTTVKALAAKGFPILSESAAEVILEMQAEGKDPDRDYLELQRRIFEKQWKKEEGIINGTFRSATGQFAHCTKSRVRSPPDTSDVPEEPGSVSDHGASPAATASPSAASLTLKAGGAPEEGSGECKDALIFLDRSLIDTLAYYELRGMPVSQEFAERAKRHRYAKVFLLDLLPFVKDGIRFEHSQAEVERIQTLLQATYKRYGYDVIALPVAGVEERIEAILSRLNAEETRRSPLPGSA